MRENFVYTSIIQQKRGEFSRVVVPFDPLWSRFLFFKIVHRPVLWNYEHVFDLICSFTCELLTPAGLSHLKSETGYMLCSNFCL